MVNSLSEFQNLTARKLLLKRLVPFFVAAMVLELSQVVVVDVQAILSGSEYRIKMENDVRALANKLVSLYAQCPPGACAPSNCTQDFCFPLEKKLHQECANITMDGECKSYFAGKCKFSSIYITKEESGVTYVRNSLSDQELSKVQADAICRTKGLDKTFQSLARNNPFHTDYYVGFLDGSCRSYPGREEGDSCSMYDTRRRPWYIAALSHPNHLVVLFDTTSHMNESLGYSPPNNYSAVEVAQKFATSLLETVNPGDLINLVTFGESADEPDNETPPIKVLFDMFNTESHTELKNVKDRIKNLKANGTMTLSSFTAALNTTLRQLENNSDATTSPTKNVILFTDGDFSKDYSPQNHRDLNQVLDEFKKQNATIFAFRFVKYAEVTGAGNGLKALIDRAGGLFTNVTSFKNPLYEMRSYFGYMATLHKELFVDAPLWTDTYMDFFGVENISTVAYPAFLNETLIGVAAIDVLLDELTNFLKDDFATALIGHENRPSGASPYRKPIIYKGSALCNSSNESPKPVCQDSNTRVDREGYKKRKCCNKCRIDNDKSTLGLVVGLPVGIGFLLILGTSGYLWYKYKVKRGHSNVESISRGQGRRSRGPVIDRDPMSL